MDWWKILFKGKPKNISNIKDNFIWGEQIGRTNTKRYIRCYIFRTDNTLGRDFEVADLKET